MTTIAPRVVLPSSMNVIYNQSVVLFHFFLSFQVRDRDSCNDFRADEVGSLATNIRSTFSPRDGMQLQILSAFVKVIRGRLVIIC